MMFEAQTEWIAPDNFPDLSGYNLIAIDLETKDPDLKSKGSGAVIGNGEIIGVAVAVDGWCKYYPFGHEGGGNLDKKKILEWLKSVCATEGTKVFHNAMYDVCWLRSYGIKVNGYIMDTMVMASLVDENRMRYTLNALSWEYLGERKSEATLREIAKNWGIDAKAELYKLPAIYVGEYAEKDAYLTLNLFKRLSTEIKKENLTEIFDLETQLFPCLVDMRFKGVRVDVERAHKLKQQLSTQEKTLLSQVKQETGIDVQIMAARSVAKVFDKLKLHYERTLKAKEPSFTKNFLAEHDHPVVKMIAKAREINKAHSTFIDSILRYEHKGRIHADINQTRSDQGGTVTGRFSYSNPNLQQIPARNKDLGPLIRSLFIPENDCQWGCFDYNQQEPRLVVHFAATTAGIKEDASVKEIVSNYSNSGIDFHETVADMAGINRIQAKTINLGLFYGMGKAKLQAELGLSTKQEAEELFDQYHERVPFVKELMNTTSRWASREGEIRTLLGRGCRFNKWEPAQFGMHVPMTWEDAMKKYGENRIRRAFTYKALNKLIQGSAADMTKKSMLNLYKEGIVAHIQIHDELDISVESDKKAKRIVQIMESAVKLEIPNKVDYEAGKNWGEIH
ncbi:MAG: DNA polymerase [Candidatus Woesearchaeota archaeon]|jgi:DNA polymerase I-like protein with 3'-5' exonuclease and polymerase domains|nr:DNA polymerase [Candidatus Woesearchaeota archaeon]